MNPKVFLILATAFLLLGRAPCAFAQLKQYKDLRNDFIKVIDVREQDKTEEKYVDVGGKLELQEVTRKTIRVTAEIVAKPPSTMGSMFKDESSVPFFKVCMSAYGPEEKKIGDDDCKALKFGQWVRGDVGAAVFELPEGLDHYALRVIKKVDNKSEAFKLWVPTE